VNVMIQSFEIWCRVVWYIGNNALQKPTSSVLQMESVHTSEMLVPTAKCWCLLPNYMMPHARRQFIIYH
jgi:hypothetical protein